VGKSEEDVDWLHTSVLCRPKMIPDVIGAMHGNELHLHIHRIMVLLDSQLAVGLHSREEYLDNLGEADGENAV